MKSDTVELFKWPSYPGQSWTPDAGPSCAPVDSFEHQIGLRSTGRLEDVAQDLKGRINAEWIFSEGFEDIVLVGHSLGGLIVRQTFLLAKGAAGDDGPCEWASKISRIVLFASLNRGIDPTRKIEHRLITRFVLWIYRLFPFLPYPLVLDAVKGSDFLGNLRINWIRLFFSHTMNHGDGTPPLPQVVQLVGKSDDLVYTDDSKDVLSFPNGHYLPVPDADHKHVYRLAEAPDPELRYAVLRKAFLGSFPAVANADDAQPPVRRVVFLLHGIRASNVDEWIKELKTLIEERARVHTIVRWPTYGYFTAMRFALPSVRRRNIAVFQDWYTEALAEYPNSEFGIIAHSNGTYMLGQALASLPGMRFKNVILAGSVLPQSFWTEVKNRRHQVGRVRNERANRDWPVALLCNALRGLFMRDVGTAGFGGFFGSDTLEVAYYPGGHGAALTPANQTRLVDFVFDSDLEEPPGLQSDPGYFRQLSNLMPYLARILFVLGTAALVVWIFQGWTLHVARAVTAAAIILLVYIVLDIL